MRLIQAFWDNLERFLGIEQRLRDEYERGFIDGLKDKSPTVVIVGSVEHKEFLKLGILCDEEDFFDTHKHEGSA